MGADLINDNGRYRGDSRGSVALWPSSFIVGKVEIARFRPRARPDKRKK